MEALVGIAFLAGLVTAISPCVLPVLPIVFAGGANGGRRRPFAIVAGLVASFTAFTLAATALLSALGLPSDLLRNIAIGVVTAMGLSLLVPRLGRVLERPFEALGRRRPGDVGGGFLLGVSLGLLVLLGAWLVVRTQRANQRGAVVQQAERDGWRYATAINASNDVVHEPWCVALEAGAGRRLGAAELQESGAAVTLHACE